MQVQVVQPNGVLQYVIPVVVIAIVFTLRARRMTRMRPLRLNQLWIVPAIYLAIVAATFVATPPGRSAWIAAAVALIVGAAIGWQRGRLMQIHVDPETHALSQKGSPLAVLFLLGIILIKTVAQGEGRSLGFDVALVTDAALALALGMFAMTRVEMYLRAKRMLDEAGGGAAA
ncbi:CcdC protein domain-containing protein [Sphingomonas sp.]|jgi:hypothetical protein|uniref:CcdC protein domain-containing protein n=1 Tax=Sphingomonas sp. TaxID=28214 RepID=UPI002E314708|nr:CcdC protein domain-containing protein [Sphingomonas sp.]HEX4695509.1 CcdC protein domain-containing protein [Sphingomonas sp.]